MIARLLKLLTPADFLTMLLILVLSILIGTPARAAAPTVATCPAQTAGTVWAANTWLPCPTVVYVAIPVPAAAIVADMSAGGTPVTWQLASAVLTTDNVWNGTVWLPATSANFSFVGSATVPPPPFTTTAVLSWTAPTANVDGSTPANLAGYNVYSGPSITGLTLLTSVGLTQLSYTATVGVGTTYFTVTAFSPDTPPLESTQPAAVAKTVVAPKSASAPATPGNVTVK